MTLGRLILAWLPVAALFTLAPPVGYRLNEPEEQQPALPVRYNRWECGWRAAEAAIVTLFASLWFDSLGAGGWWLLFLLLGLLVAFPRRLVIWRQLSALRRRHLLTHAGCDVARYVLAGALLAWLLK